MKIVVLANTAQKEELSLGLSSAASLVWVSEVSALAAEAGAEVCIDLLFDESEERIGLLKKLQTQTTIINSVADTLHEQTAGFIRFNGWNSFLKRPIAEAAAADRMIKQRGEIVFSLIGKKTGWVPDVVGFISPRVVASIINEAYYALEEQVSTKEEIDTAMKLGTNYPYGPFEWCIKIGVREIFTLLARLAKEEKRYEPAPLLMKEASM